MCLPDEGSFVTESSTARRGRFNRGTAVDPCRRRFRQDAGDHRPHRPHHQHGPRLAGSGAGGDFHQQGRRRNAGPGGAIARRRLPAVLGLHISFVVRAVAATRGAGHRAVARLRHLRLVGSARGRQAGAEVARHRRQDDSASRRPQPHQPGQEPHGRAGCDALARLGPARPAGEQDLRGYSTR